MMDILQVVESGLVGLEEPEPTTEQVSIIFNLFLL
jgi:hypothetical protein